MSPETPAAKAPKTATKPAAAPKAAPAAKATAPAKPGLAPKPAKASKATTKAVGKAAAKPSQPHVRFVDPHAILLHPVVTEKTMRLMDENNSLEFLVRRESTKPQVKTAVEKLFECTVATVNTRVTRDGKRAIVKFGGETSAEDIGMRIGVF